MKDIPDQALFQLFVAWKYKCFTIEELQNITGFDLLHILETLESYLEQNLISVESGPKYCLVQTDHTNYVIETTLVILQQIVDKELDAIISLLSSKANQWKNALEQWESLNKSKKPILEEYFLDQSIILRKALYSKAKQELHL